jgi:hypothetical protein
VLTGPGIGQSRSNSYKKYGDRVTSIHISAT